MAEVHTRVAAVISSVDWRLIEVCILTVNIVDDDCSISSHFTGRKILWIVTWPHSPRHSIAVESIILVVTVLTVLPTTAIVYVAIAILIGRQLALIAAPPVHVFIPTITGIRAGTIGHNELLKYDARAEGNACLYTYS